VVLKMTEYQTVRMILHFPFYLKDAAVEESKKYKFLKNWYNNSNGETEVSEDIKKLIIFFSNKIKKYKN
jgi:hypothetical protein